MRWKGWDRVELEVHDPSDHTGRITVSAIAPVVVSASRSTDIPAFYADWFMNRLNAEYVKWKSPFGGQPVYVSFTKTRVFAFWSKNPAPFLPVLDLLDQKQYGYFFLFTLNDYEKDRIEPGIPSLEDRIRTFRQLSQRIGAGRMIWRFDPLLLSDHISIDDLLDRIEGIGDRIFPYTRRLVVSFIDIAKYSRVQRNLMRSGFGDVRELSDREEVYLAGQLSALNERWALSISACGEHRDLSHFGISRGQCIGYDMLREEFREDPALAGFLTPPLQESFHRARKERPPDPRKYFKDPGQRSTCGCVVSKDIGQYSTCAHGCVYCYANASPATAEHTYRSFLKDRANGLYHESIS